MNTSPTASPEISLSLDGFRIDYDLATPRVTVFLTDWRHWHPDTRQRRVARGVLHFVEPGGRVVGLCCEPLTGHSAGRGGCAHD